jgi:hypothetical protein
MTSEHQKNRVKARKKLRASAEQMMNRLQELSPSLEAMQRNLDQRNRALVQDDFIGPEAVESWEYLGATCFIVRNRMHAGMKVAEMIIADKLAQAKQDMDDIARKLNLTGHLITNSILDGGEYNGYCRFPKLPGEATGYGGIYTYVPVHGGLTFFQEWIDGSVTYGFDTSHFNSSEALCTLPWMREQTEQMVRGILIAARFEKYYLRAGNDNDKKGRILDRMARFLGNDLNTGVMLNLLSGEL